MAAGKTFHGEIASFSSGCSTPGGDRLKWAPLTIIKHLGAPRFVEHTRSAPRRFKTFQFNCANTSCGSCTHAIMADTANQALICGRMVTMSTVDRLSSAARRRQRVRQVTNSNQSSLLQSGYRRCADLN